MLQDIYFSCLCKILFILFSYFYTWLSSLVLLSFSCKIYVYKFGYFEHNEVQGLKNYYSTEVTQSFRITLTMTGTYRGGPRAPPPLGKKTPVGGYGQMVFVQQNFYFSIAGPPPWDLGPPLRKFLGTCLNNEFYTKLKLVKNVVQLC